MYLLNYLLTYVLAVAASDPAFQTYMLAHLLPRSSIYILTYLPES